MKVFKCSSQEGPVLASLLVSQFKSTETYDKLESEDYQEIIARIAKELRIHTWQVHESDNPMLFLIEVTRFYDCEVGDEQERELHTTILDFLDAVKKAVLPVFEENCPTHEPANEDAEVLAKELEFVKSIKEDLGDSRGAVIAPIGIPLGIAYALNGCDIIGRDCLARMIDAYLKEYDHE